MNVDPKVIAAISSAVGYYLQAEQEAMMAQQQRITAQPVVMSSPFSIAGRQSAMDVRWAWQMRIPR
ncbi:MAG: hypothetical protein AAGU11_23170 [Syntrophobacteraceae bacterium]